LPVVSSPDSIPIATPSSKPLKEKVFYYQGMRSTAFSVYSALGFFR